MPICLILILNTVIGMFYFSFLTKMAGWRVIEVKSIGHLLNQSVIFRVYFFVKTTLGSPDNYLFMKIIWLFLKLL